MKTIETKVYEYNELSDAAKEKAREWKRRCNDGDNSFADCVIDDAVTISGFMGIDFALRDVPLRGGGKRQEPCIFWSGFSSQGDGACFEGTWRASGVNLAKLKEHAPQDAELHRICGEFEQVSKEYQQSSFSVKHSSHYSHEYCTNFTVDLDGEDGNTLRTSEQGEKAADESETALIEAARDFMRWIYKQIQDAYEYDNADEQIAESILANEYTFTEDGKRF